MKTLSIIFAIIAFGFYIAAAVLMFTSDNPDQYSFFITMGGALLFTVAFLVSQSYVDDSRQYKSYMRKLMDRARRIDQIRRNKGHVIIYVMLVIIGVSMITCSVDAQIPVQDAHGLNGYALQWRCVDDITYVMVYYSDFKAWAVYASRTYTDPAIVVANACQEPNCTSGIQRKSIAKWAFPDQSTHWYINKKQYRVHAMHLLSMPEQLSKSID